MALTSQPSRTTDPFSPLLSDPDSILPPDQRHHATGNNLQDLLASSPILGRTGGEVPIAERVLKKERRWSSDSASVRTEDLDNLRWSGMDRAQERYNLTADDDEEDEEEEEDEEDEDTRDDHVMSSPDGLGLSAASASTRSAVRESAHLSEQAERILANAKKRLKLMESNIRGARDTLISPAVSISPITTPSPTSTRSPSLPDKGEFSGSFGSGPKNRLLINTGRVYRTSSLNNHHNGPLSPNSSHYRVASDNNPRYTDRPYRPSAANTIHARSASSLASYTSPPPPAVREARTGIVHNPAPFLQSRSLRPSRSQDVLRDAQPAHVVDRMGSGSRLDVLEEHDGDDIEHGGEVQNPNVLLDDEEEPIIPGAAVRSENGMLHQPARSQLSASPHSPDADFRSSTHSTRELKNQVDQLNKRISSLRERAREEKLRRNSMQRNSSPFTDAEAHGLNGQWPDEARLSQASSLERRGSEKAREREKAQRDLERGAYAGSAPLQQFDARESFREMGTPPTRPIDERAVLDNEPQVVYRRESKRGSKGSRGSRSSRPGTWGNNGPVRSFFEEETPAGSSEESGGEEEESNIEPQQQRQLRDRYAPPAKQSGMRKPTQALLNGPSVSEEEEDEADEEDEEEMEIEQEEDATLAAIRHEDRPDAFDYEHFILHSVMGSVLRSSPPQTSSSHSSSSSTSSVASSSGDTARAPLEEDTAPTGLSASPPSSPPVPRTPPQFKSPSASPSATPQARIRRSPISRPLGSGHARQYSVDSESTDATFATAIENGMDSPRRTGPSPLPSSANMAFPRTLHSQANSTAGHHRQNSLPQLSNRSRQNSNTSASALTGAKGLPYQSPGRHPSHEYLQQAHARSRSGNISPYPSLAHAASDGTLAQHAAAYGNTTSAVPPQPGSIHSSPPRGINGHVSPGPGAISSLVTPATTAALANLTRPRAATATKTRRAPGYEANEALSALLSSTAPAITLNDEDQELVKQVLESLRDACAKMQARGPEDREGRLWRIRLRTARRGLSSGEVDFS